VVLCFVWMFVAKIVQPIVTKVRTQGFAAGGAVSNSVISNTYSVRSYLCDGRKVGSVYCTVCTRIFNDSCFLTSLNEETPSLPQVNNADSALFPNYYLI
jgi:hypothetical protein